MKKLSLVLCALLGLAGVAHAGSDKIDPSGYICAELVALTTTDPEPPIFEALQIDGYASAAEGAVVTPTPDLLFSLVLHVNNLCQKKPGEKVLTLWRDVRSRLPLPADGEWRADTTTCKDFNDNPDNGSGFIIWLDGYNRGSNGKGSGPSLLESDAKINSFIEACKAKPEAKMIDVLREQVKSK